MTAQQPRESLYLIESVLEDLERERAIAESEGDSEAVKVIDQEIANYLTKEVSKVDSYCSLIRREDDEAAALEREAARLSERARAKRNNIARLKAFALSVMQAFDVKEMKTPTNTLRRQGNGGVQALDVSPDFVPDEYQRITVDMRLLDWELLCEFANARKVVPVVGKVLEWPDADLILEALKQRIKCGECAGCGSVCYACGVADNQHHKTVCDCSTSKKCPRCNGGGTIPNSVPGARLLPRGEHARVL